MTGVSAAESLGIVVEEAASTGAVLSMKVQTEMLNGHAVCHGGIIFTLAATALAVARNPYNPVCSSSSCSIDFLAPAKKDDVLTARAQQLDSNDVRNVYDVKVSDQDGNAIALCRGTSSQQEAHQD